MKIFIKLIFAAWMLLLVTLAFVACGSGEDDVEIGPGGEHVHSMVVAKIVDATCTDYSYSSDIKNR